MSAVAAPAAAAVGPELVGKVAQLARRAGGRLERVLVVDVVDLDGGALVLGNLLYAATSTSYDARDSRGRFSTLHYALGDTVAVEA